MFVIFVVLAFARPAIKIINIAGDSGAATTAVIIIDDSYSMTSYAGAKTYFDISLEAAREILSSFTEKDYVYILSSESGFRVQSFPVQRNLNLPVKPVYGLLNLSEQLEKACEVFRKNPNLNRELYFITDNRINQHALIDSLPVYLHTRNVVKYVVKIAADHPTNNLSIDTAIIATSLYEINRPVTFEIQLTNYNLESSASARLNLFESNKRMAMTDLLIESGSTGSVKLTYVPRKSGQQLIHFELEDDDLSADNYYYLNFRIPEVLKVLYTDQPEGGLLKTAVQILSRQTVLDIDMTSYASWQGRQFQNYDLIVLNDPPVFQNQTVNRISEYLRQGKNLIIIPGENITPAQLNQAVHSWTGERPTGELIHTKAVDQYFTLDKDFQHSNLFDPAFVQKDKAIELPQVYKYFKMINPKDNYLYLTNGDPLLSCFRDKTQKGSLYIFGTQFKPAWTDFPFKGFYMPMLYRLFYSAGYSTENLSIYKAGNRARIPVANSSSSAQVEIIPPQGQPYPVDLLSSRSHVFVSMDIPGHYIINADGKMADAFSVNLNSAEMRTPYIDLDEYFLNAKIVKSEMLKGDSLRKARTGQELWFIFVLLALIMLLLEIWLVKLIEKRSEDT